MFTRNPLEPHSRQVRLFGDFAVCSQGEDLVGGLVFPLPISEAQRRGSPTYRGVEQSLETDFPDVYARLLAVAKDLVTEREYDPQEIEFTFESTGGQGPLPLAEALHGGGDGRGPASSTRRATTAPAPAAVGMGVAGGAYAGRVAVNMEQIDAPAGSRRGRTSSCSARIRSRRTYP